MHRRTLYISDEKLETRWVAPERASCLGISFVRHGICSRRSYSEQVVAEGRQVSNLGFTGTIVRFTNSVRAIGVSFSCLVHNSQIVVK